MQEVQKKFVDNIDAHVGAALKRIRKDSRYELEYVSAVSGLSIQEIAFLESGRESFSASSLFRIANALNTPINVLFDGVSDSYE